jgi:hypothetical protein
VQMPVLQRHQETEFPSAGLSLKKRLCMRNSLASLCMPAI